jgi:uncharacterized protein involved in exopolysaccharide biosynthesis
VNQDRSWLLSSDFSLPDLYAVLSSRWPWLAGLALAGALIGWVSGVFIPAQYRSTASLGIGIDYARTLPLNDRAERESWLRVQELLLSDDVLSDAAAELPSEGPTASTPPTPDRLRRSIRLDRFEGRWDLTVQSVSPDASARAANAWASAAVRELGTAVEHAMRAAELQSALYEAGCQLTYLQDLGRAAWSCETVSEDGAAELQGALLDEVQASKGILPALTFTVLRRAEPEPQPVRAGRIWLMVGGLLMGLAIGTGVVLFVPASVPSPIHPGHPHGPQAAEDGD